MQARLELITRILSKNFPQGQNKTAPDFHNSEWCPCVCAALQSKMQYPWQKSCVKDQTAYISYNQ